MLLGKLNGLLLSLAYVCTCRLSYKLYTNKHVMLNVHRIVPYINIPHLIPFKKPSLFYLGNIVFPLLSALLTPVRRDYSKTVQYLFTKVGETVLCLNSTLTTVRRDVTTVSQPTVCTVLQNSPKLRYYYCTGM